MNHSPPVNKILVLILMLFTFSRVNSQTSNEKSNVGNLSSPKINQNKSGIYLAFHSYEHVKEESGDKYAKLVWLRVHNNYKWNVSVCYFESPKSKQGKTTIEMTWAKTGNGQAKGQEATR